MKSESEIKNRISMLKKWRDNANPSNATLGAELRSAIDELEGVLES